MGAFALLALAASAGGPARAQLAEGGARRLALGRAGVALPGQAWGQANPAAWTGTGERWAATEASQSFALSELRLGAFAAGAPTSLGTLALGARTYGAEAYRETHLAAGLSRPFRLSPARRLDAGLALGWSHVAVEGFPGHGGLALSAGLAADVLPGLRGGLAARNLDGLWRSAEAEGRRPLSDVPSLGVGLAYAPSPGVLVLLDAEQDEGRGLSLRGGLEARPLDALALRLGGGTGPVRYSAGAGFTAARLRADIAAEWHAHLGVTPAVSVEVSF